MKAKTKRRLKHLVGKKKLIKKQAAKKFWRSVFLSLAGASTASLAYASVTLHPTVDVNVHSALSNKTLSAPVTVTNGPAAPAPGQPNQKGRASWYALGLPAPDSLTCASRTFPRRSMLEVTNLNNGRKVTCRVNDYGPEAWTNRVIDLSRGSFREVENLGRGTIPVEIRLVSGDTSYNLSLDSKLAAAGYSLCRQKYSAGYCEEHRQQDGLILFDSK